MALILLEMFDMYLSIIDFEAQRDDDGWVGRENRPDATESF